MSRPSDWLAGAIKFDPAKLSDGEVFWHEHQKWLEGCGYMLRDRYMPGWKPSWLNAKKRWYTCEDGQIPALSTTILDATRISDGTYVSLKSLSKSIHPYEADIGTYLTSGRLASDPANHCVPIIEVLNVPDVEDRIILVMPLLRKYDKPNFQTIGEAVDFFTQTFEGLLFMHKHHVAHRDCMSLNIMMDGTMFPESWHPCAENRRRDCDNTRSLKSYTRSQRPPKYYFIDFGLSRRYDPADGPPLELPIEGGDKTVPEFRLNGAFTPCDPFPTDVYYIGNTIRMGFMLDNSGFEFISPLIADMVQDDPGKRPTMDEVVSRFVEIRQNLSDRKLRSRITGREESVFFSACQNLVHWVRSLRYKLQGLPAVPSRSTSGQQHAL